MTYPRRKALTWFISGVAFVTVIAFSGCAQHSPATRSRGGGPGAAAPGPAVHQPSPAQQQLHERQLYQRVEFQGPPPSINVFGETDGTPRTVRPVATGETGFQQHTFLDEGYDGDVAVSPDGRWITFSSTRHNTNADIYLQRVDGLSVTQLTSDEHDDAFPVFSPDGRQIAFSSTRAGSWDIYLMDVGGRNAVQITSGPSQDLHPSFSPDGSKLVYCSLGSRSGQWELWTVDLTTSQKRMIGYGLFPSWSPDRSSDRVAFQRARARGSRWFSLWTLELVDGEARRLTEVAVSGNAAVVSPVWSPDGKRLAFSTIVEPARAKDGKPLGQQDIWVINADGTGRQRVTDGTGTNAAPYWGADGRVYFVSDRGGTECIWSASAGKPPEPTMSAGRDSERDDTTPTPEALAAPETGEVGP